jgi:hypothetical protein
MDLLHYLILSAGLLVLGVYTKKLCFQYSPTNNSVINTEINVRNYHYISELEKVRSLVLDGLRNGSLPISTTNQILDLLNDAAIPADVDYCKSALNAVALKLNRLAVKGQIESDFANRLSSSIRELDTNFLSTHLE